MGCGSSKTCGGGLVTVFGATGNQGGAVACALLADKRYKVRAVTRDPESEKSKTLAEKGAEVVKGDLSDKKSLKAAIEGSDYVFLNTSFWVVKDVKKEIQQGKNVVDVIKEFIEAGKAAQEEKAKEAAEKKEGDEKKEGEGEAPAEPQVIYMGPKLLVYTGAESGKDLTGEDVPPFDGKAEIEKYMKEQEIPSCSLRVPFYMDNFLMKKFTKNDDGSYMIMLPLGNEAIDAMCLEDIGECVHSVFNNAANAAGRTTGLSAEKLSNKKIVQVLNKHLAPLKFVDAEVTIEQMAANKEMPGADIFAKVFKIMRENQNRCDLAMSKKLNPKLLSFDKWVAKNKDAWKKHVEPPSEE